MNFPGTPPPFSAASLWLPFSPNFIPAGIGYGPNIVPVGPGCVPGFLEFQPYHIEVDRIATQLAGSHTHQPTMIST